MTRTLHVMRDHRGALDVWRELGVERARVLHVDAHCDLRGLLVAPGEGRAAAIARRLKDPRGPYDGGDYLARAAVEGRATSVRWVYGRWGGRDRDLGTVVPGLNSGRGAGTAETDYRYIHNHVPAQLFCSRNRLRRIHHCCTGAQLAPH